MIIPVGNCGLGMAVMAEKYTPHNALSVGVDGVEAYEECYASNDTREVRGGSVVSVNPKTREAICLLDCPHCIGMSVER